MNDGREDGGREGRRVGCLTTSDEMEECSREGGSEEEQTCRLSGLARRWACYNSADNH
jgi:hypothetical protein